MLITANVDRARGAADRSVAQARALLDRPDCPRTYREVLQARVDHPAASLREVAATVGMTKDAYASALRRALTGRHR